jgi:hypothetical protein
MDDELLKMSGVSAGTIAIVLLVYKIAKQLLGKRLVSNCCGKKLEVGVEIKDTVITPDVCLEIKNPIHKENDESKTGPPQ